MGRLELQIRVVAVILMKEAGLKHGVLNCTDSSNRLGANHLLLLKVVGMQRQLQFCLLYTSPSPRDATLSRMPSSA